MVTSLLRSRLVRSSLEMAALSMLTRRALREYVDRREASQWGVEERRYSSWTPRVTIEDNEDNYIVLAELAGVRPEDIKLSLAGNSLILEGKRQLPAKTQAKGTDLQEIRHGTFSRKLLLPDDAEKDEDNIEASFDNGILEIRVPRLRSEIPIEKVRVKTK